MKVKVSDLKNALLGIESNRQLSSDIVEGALVEALSKAYRKHVNIPDGYVHVAIENGHIHIYPQRMVVEEVEDDALEFVKRKNNWFTKNIVTKSMIWF